MKKSILRKIVLLGILTTSLYSQEKSAEALIKSMKKEDITYSQLMQGMSEALNNIQSGIISTNSMLVNRGINFVRTHPAPRNKPWIIMEKEDRDSFKASLLYFDKKMDEDVLVIEKAVQKREWNQALDALNTFSNTCMACHNSWKDKVKYIME